MANLGSNAQYDWVNGQVDLPVADAFNSQSSLVTFILNGQVLQYTISFIQSLGVALLRQDVNLPDRLDNHCYGVVGIPGDEAFQAICQSTRPTG